MLLTVYFTPGGLTVGDTVPGPIFTGEVGFEAKNRGERYEWVCRVLRQQEYGKLKREPVRVVSRHSVPYPDAFDPPVRFFASSRLGCRSGIGSPAEQSVAPVLM